MTPPRKYPCCNVTGYSFSLPPPNLKPLSGTFPNYYKRSYSSNVSISQSVQGQVSGQREAARGTQCALPLPAFACARERSRAPVYVRLQDRLRLLLRLRSYRSAVQDVRRPVHAVTRSCTTGKHRSGMSSPGSTDSGKRDSCRFSAALHHLASSDTVAPRDLWRAPLRAFTFTLSVSARNGSLVAGAMRSRSAQSRGRNTRLQGSATFSSRQASSERGRGLLFMFFLGVCTCAVNDVQYAGVSGKVPPNVCRCILATLNYDDLGSFHNSKFI